MSDIDRHEVLVAAQDFLTELEANASLQDRERAVGWCVVAHDDEHCLVSVHGIYDEPTAKSKAAAFYDDINKLNTPGEPGWTVVAKPILPLEL